MHQTVDDELGPWEFAHCGICYLPFIDPRNPDAPPPIPFWLTDCGHIVCNSHLNADQTCRQCATNQPVAVMPLARDLSDPMRSWFRPMSHSLLDLADAAKFQHESLAGLIRFYKSKCLSQKELIARLRQEVDTLKAENARWKEQTRVHNDSHDIQGSLAEMLNENGKRRRYEDGDVRGYYGNQVSAQPTSNPNDTVSRGSSRLTLRPGSSRMEQEQGYSYLSASSGERDRQPSRQGRRSSPLSLEEFAYQPAAAEAGRGSTARGHKNGFDGSESTHPSSLRSELPSEGFGFQGLRSTTSRPVAGMQSSPRIPPISTERTKPLVQSTERQPVGTMAGITPVRQRFQPGMPSTPLPARQSNAAASAASTHQRPTITSTGGMQVAGNPTSGSGSRRFVPPVLTRQTNPTFPPLGHQPARTLSQMQMPPPPPPGSARPR